MNNKYFFRARIFDSKFRTVLRLFCLYVEAKKVIEFTGLNRGCINNIYNKFRERIAELCETESPFINGERVNLMKVTLELVV